MSNEADEVIHLAALREHAPQADELATRYGHALYLAIVHRAWGVAHRLTGEWVAVWFPLDQALAQGGPGARAIAGALEAFDARGAGPAAARTPRVDERILGG